MPAPPVLARGVTLHALAPAPAGPPSARGGGGSDTARGGDGSVRARSQSRGAPAARIWRAVRSQAGPSHQRTQLDALLRLHRDFPRLHLLLSQFNYTTEQAGRVVAAVPAHLVGARVEAVVSLYARVLDLAHFRTHIVDRLSAAERAAVYRRLGLLNVWHPQHPDGAYDLDLATWEDWRVAEVLVRYEMAEPGPNW